MKNQKTPTLGALSILILFACTTAQADDVPANSVRAGLEAVFYHTNADDLSGPYVPPGVNLEAENLQTLYLAYVRRLSPHFAVELAMGYPPLAKIKGSGPAMLGSVPYNGQEISSARWIAPTAFLEYNFLSESSRWRPFIGVGVNYTTFYDRDSTAAGNAASGGPTRISLTSSVGAAGTAGIDYRFDGHWHMYGSYSISQVKTDLTANTAGIVRTSTINFAPQVLVVSVGYSF
jgi:outer membrane protein